MIKEILILQKSILTNIKVVSNDDDKPLKEAYIGNGKIINSEFLNGIDIVESKIKIIDKI